ncbi:MAG: hypothetical protein ACFCUR_20415 [Rhodomicrobiaceae bacterium]
MRRHTLTHSPDSPAVDRVHILDQGGRLDLGDRRIVSLRPPYYDAPEIAGFFDTKSRAYFSADAFGALLDEPAESAEAIDAAQLRDGMTTWAAIDAPWLGQMDEGALGRTLGDIERFDPSVILSGHLPHARGLTGQLTSILSDAYRGGPADAPDHDYIEQLVEAARHATV